MSALRDKKDKLLEKARKLEQSAGKAVSKTKESKLLREFREFAIRGNMLDLAIGIMIGAGFNQVVNSLVNDIITPPIGLILGRVDFANLFVDLTFHGYSTIAQAKAAGAPTLNYGLFINTVINFLITAFVVFLLVKQINKLRRKPGKAPDTKECPYCCSAIPLRAVRCRECTSNLENMKEQSVS